MADLVGAGRWNEGDQPFEELVPLHEDVRRPIPPPGLESQREASVRPLFEAIVCEGRAGDVAAEPLEAAPVAGRDGDVGMEAHPPVLRRVRGCSGVVLADGLDLVAHPSPSLAGAGTHGDARTQRRRRQRGEQRFVACEGVVVSLGSRCDEPCDAASRSGEHARQLVRARRG
jgi:hypothetical protein